MMELKLAEYEMRVDDKSKGYPTRFFTVHAESYEEAKHDAIWEYLKDFPDAEPFVSCYFKKLG